MTRLTKRLSLAAVGILVLAEVAGADQLKRQSYRPYITEVGAPRAIDRRRLDKEIVLNSDLRSWVQNYGYPDVAEIQEVVPEFGWSAYEVRTYYLDRNQELAFGRVSFFPAMRGSFVEDYGLVKFQGTIQPENLKRVEYAARIAGCGSGETSLDRILAAAERAERASTVAERESLRALASAERAEAAAGRLESGFSHSLRK